MSRTRVETERAGSLAPLLAAPLMAPEEVVCWGRTLIVAPHPDDESLGCGGAVALLSSMNRQTFVLVMTDGAASHPNSVAYPRERLRAVRESETLAALAQLGVTPQLVTFLRLDDRRMPNQFDDARGSGNSFEQVVEICRRRLASVRPQTILLPWRRDPHPDHRATWQVIDAACQHTNDRPRLIEYPIWIWEMDEGDDAPRAGEVRAWRLDISTVVERKQRAIAAHVSQTTDLINDDPSGFRLSAQVLGHFARPWELYFEVER